MKRLVHPAAVVLVAAVLCGLVSLSGNDYYLRIAFMMCVYYLCAAGMNVLVGYAGQKSLGQAGLFAAGAYAVALITSRTELNPWLALVIAAVVSGVCGVLIALPSLRVKGPYLAWSRWPSASWSRSSWANGPTCSAARRASTASAR